MSYGIQYRNLLGWHRSVATTWGITLIGCYNIHGTVVDGVVAWRQQQSRQARKMNLRKKPIRLLPWPWSPLKGHWESPILLSDICVQLHAPLQGIRSPKLCTTDPTRAWGVDRQESHIGIRPWDLQPPDRTHRFQFFSILGLMMFESHPSFDLLGAYCILHTVSFARILSFNTLMDVAGGRNPGHA